MGSDGTMVTNTLDALLKDGFARPRAEEYLSILKEELDRPDLFDPDYTEWAHAHGFFAKQAYAYDLNEDNLGDYMSDYDYHRVWPLNSWQRIWINDKMTLKYMFAGTDLDQYFPEYYFYTSPQGLIPMPEGGKSSDEKAFLAVLRDKREFACKPCNGARTVGFHKLSYDDNGYAIDNMPATDDDILAFMRTHVNYLFTEFLHPSAQMAAISPVINNLRLMVFNPTGTDPVIGASYFRFATGVGDDDSKSNYRYPSEQDAGNYNVWFNWKTGWFGGGKDIYANRVIDSPEHPETGVRAEGILENWREVCSFALDMSDRINPLEYLGYDICITDKGPKVIEINSHSGSKYVQFFHPFYKDEFLSSYFRSKIEAIEALDEDGIRRRNSILR